jgi:capsular polysaccharide transport system ATP-binding protein
MIELKNIYKSYATKSGPTRVLSNISYTFHNRKNTGILGLNGAGKSTLLRIMAGVELPSEGEVIHHGRISWPIGFGGGFNASLSGEENCRFVARIYGEDVDRVVGFANDFAEIGKYFYMPIRTYSSGMRGRLAFGLSMAINFDVYMVDEVTAVGDKPFQDKCREAFRERQERSSVIMVSHSMGIIKQYCENCAVLHGGVLQMYDTVEEAAEVYDRVLKN